MYFGIIPSTFTIRFHFFHHSDFPNSFTLNLAPDFVEGGIFNFTTCPYTHFTSILHHKIRSKIGTSYVFSKSKLSGSFFVFSFLDDSHQNPPLNPALQNKSSIFIHPDPPLL